MLREQTYRKILLSKGYRYSEENNIFLKQGRTFRPYTNHICSFLVMEQKDFKKMQSEGIIKPNNEFEVVLSKELDEYEEALALINDFSFKEYGSIPNTSRTLISIPLAYTTIRENEDMEISVYCDLINQTVSTFLDGVEVEKITYANIKSMIKYFLTNLDFDSLVSVDDEWIEKKDEKERVYIKKHDDRLTLGECLHLLREMVKIGLLENDYSEENDEDPESRLLIYREESNEYPEGWYSEDFISVASELSVNPGSQKNLWKALEEVGYEPVFEEV